ncbi:MAG: S8 family serine peptidase [Acidimicrobiales bacterium]
MHRRSTLLALSAVLLSASSLVGCDVYRPPIDCTDWRYGPDDEPSPGVIPTEYPRTEQGWKLGSLRDDDVALRNSVQNQCGQIGAAVDLAWGVTTGRDDVLIAVLDSGIQWRDAGDMAELAAKAYLNRGELTVPCGVASGDCNGDGRFDIGDFAAGAGGGPADLNGNGLADPEDLILDPAQNNGIDDDGNGYIDDISGWDFLYGDNNPLDTVNNGHGTGEAKDSTAAANGTGDVGTCPDCRFLPVRVGDSFITDGGRFAAGVLFALDSGADVVQEALGVISNPRQAQQAVDAAYERGVVVVASMADEASKHANLPAALERTMPVNSVTKREHNLTGHSDGWLALNGCTNWGAITWVSVPSSSCSSEATGLGAGIVGLIESAARDADLPRHPSLPRSAGADVLSAAEVMQVVAAYADDIDFATPRGAEPANNYGGSTGDLVPSERYPTRPGWDQVNGFGRINAYEAVRLVSAGRIPPEAALSSPRWFDVLPVSGSFPVEGEVGARFADSYSYRVEWTVGASPPAHPGSDQWHVVAEKTGLRRSQRGRLGRIDLAEVAAALPDGGTGTPVDDSRPNGMPDEDRFAVRVRVVVTAEGGDADGLTGVAQKQVFVHDDPDLVAGFPRQVPGASTSSPVFVDLDRRPGDELVVATTDGAVHAYRANGREAPGWPVRTTVAPWWPTGSPTAAAEHIRPQRSAVMVGAPAVADIDLDGRLDVVVTDYDGNVWAWNHRGRRLPGFGTTRGEGRRGGQVHVNGDWSRDDPAAQDEHNRTKPGFIGSPALGQLDSDPELEIVAAAMDRHVYAWNHDGSPVPGWPVLVVDPAEVGAVDPTSHRVTFVDDSVREGGEIVATPALADLTGDGLDEVVIGAQEAYEEPINIGDSAEIDLITSFGGAAGNTRLYVLSPEGRNAANPDRSAAHPDDTAYRPGWPAKVGQIQLELLPVIGDGVVTQAAIGDVVPSTPGPEIVAASPGGPVYVFTPEGRSAYGANPVNGRDNPALWTGGLFGSHNSRYGPARNSHDIQITPAAFSGPAIGRIDGDAQADFAAPTAGLSRMVDLATPDLQLPNDDQLMAWQGGDTGNALAGFPQVTSDLAFFVTPAIADLDGDGQNEVVAGNGVAVLSAHAADGSRPAGWPKLHGGWVVGTPGLGDLDADGLAELAVVRRDGTLFVWHTRQPAAQLDQWPRFGGNARNTGGSGG